MDKVEEIIDINPDFLGTNWILVNPTGSKQINYLGVCGWYRRCPMIELPERNNVLGGSGRTFPPVVSDYDMTAEESVKLGQKSFYNAANRGAAPGSASRVYQGISWSRGNVRRKRQRKRLY